MTSIFLIRSSRTPETSIPAFFISGSFSGIELYIAKFFFCPIFTIICDYIGDADEFHVLLLRHGLGNTLADDTEPVHSHLGSWLGHSSTSGIEGENGFF